MNTKLIARIQCIVVLGTMALPVFAQNSYDPPEQPPGGRPPFRVPPILAALDSNKDGVIDANEIKAAAQALGALAKDTGGTLTMRDLSPPPPRRDQRGDDAVGPGNGRPEGNGPAAPGDRPNDGPAEAGARPDDGPGRGRPPGPIPPIEVVARTLFQALDANHDGTLDQGEIANASEALKKLDADGDGNLTMYELLRPARDGGPRPEPRGTNGPASRTPASPAVSQAPSQQAQPNGAASTASPGVAVTFTGGFETDPRDGGRPVALIAAALNVPDQVFRDAFSHVRPATGGREPEPEQVRLNKQALLQNLAPYGVTNDRLDAVSNYYRYNRAKGEMWRNAPASATATVRNGVVTGIVITNAGAGYSTSPKISIAGMPNLKTTVTLSFGADFSKNGSIKSVTIDP